ncbi:hypothetical protein HYPSUDRAFT_37853 [Hypholoma sublateritium FD-334 SS-4]|uniref:Uncharacterized protein n=1 Tax=Hypholoma sublateritium (strain FD-334 SS-4) TaxID=945553 RepID=A0A0D2P9Q6_HYPSF|nr:hypothetical protein HYPSUDRAFT_37853 [Hypholoma sublateritium FD-334 SS-4]
MHASSQSQAPCPPNFTRDRPKPDLQSAVRQAVAVRDLARVDDEKDKKYAKKTSYPSVGFRVRPGKDGQTRARGLSSAAQQPLMTSTPRPLRSADTVLAYQQQQKQKLQAIADGPPANGGPASSSSYEEDLNRSRSSSFSHVQPNPSQQHQQQPSQHSDSAAEDLQYPFFGGATPSEMLNMQQMLPRKRYSIHEQTQPPQPLSPEHPPFTPHIFDQSHSQAMYEQAYDGSSGTAVEGIGYSTVSSPFSNGAPTSSSGSPFTTTSVVSGGHPPTPTFGPHAPVFGPQPLDDLPTSSPTTYFHTPNVFNDSAYPGPSTSSAHLSHQQQQHNMALGLNMEMSISSAPGYEKAAHQNAMYDIKSSIEQHQIAHQQRQMPAMEGYDDQGHQLGMGMPAAASWTAEQQRQQPQQPHQQSPSNAFWSNGPEYRFYP